MLTNLQEQEIDLHVRLELSRLKELEREADRLFGIKVGLRRTYDHIQEQYRLWLREQASVEPSEEQDREQQQWVINCATAYEKYAYAQCMADAAHKAYENYRYQMFSDGPVPIKSDLVFKD